ncbi:MAG: glycogen debranching protein GlgX, partial [Bacteroidota bacterium]
MMLNGELMKEMDEFGNDLKQEILLILVNSYWETVPFTLPKEGLGEEWEVLEDTSWEENPDEPVMVQNVYELQARSLVLLRNVR